MAGKPGIQIDARAFQKAMRKMNRELQRGMKAENLKAAQMVAAEARGRVPVRSGRLRKTIKARATPKAGHVRAGNNLRQRTKSGKRSGSAVPYAGPIHFGWPAHGIEPNPFLYEALDSRRGEVILVYEERVQKLVNRVGRES